MEFTIKTFYPIAPEIFVLIMSCVTLMAGIFIREVKHLPYYLVQLTLIITLLLTWYCYYILDAKADVFLFGNQFVFDRLAFVLKLFIYIITFVVFIYSRDYNDDRSIPTCEYYVLGLISTLGMMILVSAHNFIPLFLGLELMSLPIYAMVALSRSKERCVEAAMKYFITGSIASGMLLYGMSLLFGASKSLDIAVISQFIVNHMGPPDLMLLFGLVFILAGFAFKLGASPFHMWVPDVYDGAPTSSTLFLSTAPKLAAFGLMIRLLVGAMPSLSMHWSQILIVVAVSSIVFGNIIAIVQSNIKRLLGYSSIAHMGYTLLGVLTTTPEGYSAALFYIITYAIMTLAAFGIIALMARSGFEANDVSDLAGLNDRNPWLAFLMMLVMFSLAGIPPLVGFIAKVGIIEALIQVHLVWLAVLAIIFAIIGSYYYIHVVKVMYFESAEHGDPVQCSSDVKVAISLNSLLVLILGVFPGPLYALCHWVF